MTYNVNTVQFKQDETQPQTIIITVENEWYNVERIGRYNFHTKDGWLILQNGTRKEYRQWKALFNNFFKMNEMFGWTDTDINKAMEAGNEMIQLDKKIHEEEMKDKQIERAMNYIDKLNRKELQLDKQVIEMEEEQLNELVKNKFDVPCEIVALIVKAIQDNGIDKNMNKEESFTVGNRSFNDYDNAVAYCESNDWDVETMLQVG